MIRLLFSLLSFTLCLTVMAQTNFRPGFIVTAEQDTIVGELEYRSKPKSYSSCRFRKDGTISEYDAGQLRGYGYAEGEHYVSGVVEGSFVEILAAGELSLYRFGDVFFVRKNQTIHRLESFETKAMIEGKEGLKEDVRWKGILLFLMADCSPDNAKMKSLDLDERKLTNLVKWYYSCKGSAGEVYKENKSWAKINLGVTLGVTSGRIRTKTALPYLIDNYSSSDFTAGLLLNIAIPKLTEKIAYEVELQISQSDFSSYRIIENPTNTAYYRTTFSFTTISAPVSIKYLIPYRAYNFEIIGGLNYSYHMDWNSNATNTFDSNGNVTTNEIPAFEIKKSLVGFGGGAAIVRHFRKFSAGLNFRYYQMGKLSQTNWLDAEATRMLLSVKLVKR
jgi:hypothetical protein